MSEKDVIFQKMAEALLVDYSSVCYVNSVTGEYIWYYSDKKYHLLHKGIDGVDFYKDIISDPQMVIHEEDLPVLRRVMQKDNLLNSLRDGSSKDIVCRIMLDGKPVYHKFMLIPCSDDNDCFILGIMDIDREYRMKLDAERLKKERVIFNQIASSLAEHYDTLYYINIKTGRFFEYTSNDIFKSLNIPPQGDNFFAETEKSMRKLAFPEDLEKAIRIYQKPEMLKNLSKASQFSSIYRLVIDSKLINVRCQQILTNDKKHVIVCIENINDEVSAQEELEATRRQNADYSNIAGSLASHYEVIYYVDSFSGEYYEIVSDSRFGTAGVMENGKDFFSDIQVNVKRVYPGDREKVLRFLDQQNVRSVLKDKRHCSMDYRLLLDGEVSYTRLTFMWSADRVHFIIGVENINEEVMARKEQQHALDAAARLARRDELTGTKNKNAYQELEKQVQKNISEGNCEPFAIAVCDLNSLKHVNDTMGHKAGDEYIKASCKLICDIFNHSPVFRVGGDEFVVFLRGSDYAERNKLFANLKERVLENIRLHSGPVIAAGLAVYDPENDFRLKEIFDRADSRMYEDKSKLKEREIKLDSHALDDTNVIPNERRQKLDQLFNAFSVVAEGTYIYLCDMKYDYSRWSKSAVETFGLPSEYMYGAGDIWEKHIHDDDRETFRSSIAELFSGSQSGHNMQYRALKKNGEYDVCTCKGLVLCDENGEPEYFGGSIRNHGIQGHIDTLTGLRNQYGFFEDIQSNILAGRKINICMIGVVQFSEVNEVFGYHFGNMVLQRFSRYLYEYVGNTGMVYRLDGTKFAVITTLSNNDIRYRYEDLRAHYRAGLNIDKKHVMLELSAGLLTVENFALDYQTVYACLNFAYGESKTRRHGDLVQFYNDLNDENKHRIEKLHAIRASITQGYEGFYLLYQPVVDAQTEALIGAEALLRWRSDEYGTVAPDHFIPLLEKDPLFPELGEWILRSALKVAKKVLEKVPDFVMNVNLSYTQLEKHDFVDMVISVLDEVGFPHEHLCLEITERCRLLDLDLLKNVAVNLRGRGVKIALDDFGTGFSSIGIVKNLPFDIIKIDRSFVLKIEDDEKERELIKSFVQVAATFGARVCVEGIETAGMRDILQHYSVHSFQGYYYAKPIGSDELFKWIDDRNNK